MVKMAGSIHGRVGLIRRDVIHMNPALRRHPVWTVIRMVLVLMDVMTWPATCGNGLVTGMMGAKTHWFCAVARGSAVRATAVPRAGTTAQRAAGAASPVFVFPGLSRNFLLLYPPRGGAGLVVAVLAVARLARPSQSGLGLWSARHHMCHHMATWQNGKLVLDASRLRP